MLTLRSMRVDPSPVTRPKWYADVSTQYPLLYCTSPSVYNSPEAQNTIPEATDHHYLAHPLRPIRHDTRRVTPRKWYADV